MLLPQDINPINSLYFTGGLILGKVESKISFDFFELYDKTKESRNISMQSFILALDWLFLLGSIGMDKNGKITKCF